MIRLFLLILCLVLGIPGCSPTAEAPIIEISPSAANLPNPDGLKDKLRALFSERTTAGIYLLKRGDKVVKTVPWFVGVTVRSYNENTLTAEVEYVNTGAKIRIFQRWWFDGEDWTNKHDTGMVINPTPTLYPKTVILLE